MVSDLPGGGKKPRTATPLAWRLVYLVVMSVLGWSFLSTRAASAAIATDVAAAHGEIKAVLAEVVALRSGYKAALTAESVRPMLEDALEQRLSKVATQISEDMGAHVAKSVAMAVGAATRTELEGAVPTIDAAMRKQLLPQGKQLLALVQLLGELKTEFKVDLHRAVTSAVANATAAVASAAPSVALAATPHEQAPHEQAAHAVLHEAAHEAVHEAAHEAVHEAAPAVVDAAATHAEVTDAVGTPGLSMHAPQAESDSDPVGTHAEAHPALVGDLTHAAEPLGVALASEHQQENHHEEP